MVNPTWNSNGDWVAGGAILIAVLAGFVMWLLDVQRKRREER